MRLNPKGLGRWNASEQPEACPQDFIRYGTHGLTPLKSFRLDSLGHVRIELESRSHTSIICAGKLAVKVRLRRAWSLPPSLNAWLC